VLAKLKPQAKRAMRALGSSGHLKIKVKGEVP
jgi:hypothetical protein